MILEPERALEIYNKRSSDSENIEKRRIHVEKRIGCVIDSRINLNI